MLEFQEEQVASVWDELYPLAQHHHQQSENYKRHEPFNPMRERFERYNELGMFRLITARDKGLLVGYFGVYLVDSMHSQLPILTEDTLYLAPSHRGGRNAMRFITFIERYFQREIPVEVLFSCEEDNRSGIQGLLKHLDYRPVITVFSKYLPARADSANQNHLEVAHVGTDTV